MKTKCTILAKEKRTLARKESKNTKSRIAERRLLKTNRGLLT